MFHPRCSVNSHQVISFHINSLPPGKNTNTGFGFPSIESSLTHTFKLKQSSDCTFPPWVVKARKMRSNWAVLFGNATVPAMLAGQLLWNVSLSCSYGIQSEKGILRALQKFSISRFYSFRRAQQGLTYIDALNVEFELKRSGGSHLWDPFVDAAYGIPKNSITSVLLSAGWPRITPLVVEISIESAIPVFAEDAATRQASKTVPSAITAFILVEKVNIWEERGWGGEAIIGVGIRRICSPELV